MSSDVVEDQLSWVADPIVIRQKKRILGDIRERK